MKPELKYSSFEGDLSDLRFTLNELQTILPVKELASVEDGISFSFKISDELDAKVLEIYHQLYVKSKSPHLTFHAVEAICSMLDRLAQLYTPREIDVAQSILELRLAWDDQSPHAWYELGKLEYQKFISRKTDNLDKNITVFKTVIDLVERLDQFHDMGFWSYSYLANLYLYRILSGEEALAQAMKNYNLAYRFSKKYKVVAHEDFIFDDLKILQNILMNQYPLLVMIYNDSGVSMFEYIFQFVEVITQEQRFIPNFTALLSVVDDRIRELFNSPISSAYIILENRLMVMSTLYDGENSNWVKMALIFSYLQQSTDQVNINPDILDKVNQFKIKLLDDSETTSHLINFTGKHDHQLHHRIEELLHEVFAYRE